MVLLEMLKMPWSLFRILRLLFGSYIFGVSLVDGNYIFSVVGIFFIYQSIFNVGCGACQTKDIESKKLEKNNKIKVEYEEL